MAFLNIASLPKYIDELRLNMQHQYLDIAYCMILNETRLDETISNSEISIDKYTLVRNDRTRHGGSVTCISEIQLILISEMIFMMKPLSFCALRSANLKLNHF